MEFAEVPAHYSFGRAEISGLRQCERVDGRDLPTNWQDRTGHFGGNAAHADDILIVRIGGNGLDAGRAAK